jgi:hypothetical protein
MRVCAYLILMTLVSLAAPASASDEARVAEVLNKFFEASGGLEQVKNLQSVSVTANTEAYDYQYSMHLLADGRYRVEAPDRTTVYDGQDYWQLFYGVVHKLTGDDLARYEDISLDQVFLHGFLDAEDDPAAFEYVGQKETRGQTHELLAETTPEGEKRTFYLNTETGLLDKMVELVPDEDLRELKNIYNFMDYQDVGGLILPTRFQGLCVTNGEETQPLTRLSDIKVNEEPDDALFVKPESEVPPPELTEGRLHGQVVGISRGGSLITNITRDDLAKLDPPDGATLVAEVREHETHLEYMADIESFGDIGRGDYLATFNRSPTLWLVKAYLGMTSDDSTYAAGDKVRLAVSAKGEGEAGK